MLERSGWSVFVPLEQLQSLLTDAHKCEPGEFGGNAHRKSTKLKINPGCLDRVASAMEDKEGHCYSHERWAAFWGGKHTSQKYSTTQVASGKDFYK